MIRSSLVIASFVLALGVLAQTPANSAPPIPAHLPGNGLAQHDFMFTGESHDRRIFIVRHGETLQHGIIPDQMCIMQLQGLEDD